MRCTVPLMMHGGEAPCLHGPAVPGAGSRPLMVSVPAVPYASIGCPAHCASGPVSPFGRMKTVESELIGWGPSAGVDGSVAGTVRGRLESNQNPWLKAKLHCCPE